MLSSQASAALASGSSGRGGLGWIVKSHLEEEKEEENLLEAYIHRTW